ncbi:MAG: excisionase family DNA-binding protein [Paracoccaceae bacterium]
MLNVSRPHLTKLLKKGQMRFEEVGKHRRVPAAAARSLRKVRKRYDNPPMTSSEFF